MSNSLTGTYIKILNFLIALSFQHHFWLQITSKLDFLIKASAK